MGFKVLGWVAWGFIHDLVDVRHIPERHGYKLMSKFIESVSDDYCQDGVNNLTFNEE